jgi:hypothetical protein
MGATARGLVRLDAASVTACGVLSRVDIFGQPACIGDSVVRDEEAASSNPATPASSAGVRCCYRSPRSEDGRLMGSRATLPVHRVRGEALGTAGPVGTKLQPQINACARRQGGGSGSPQGSERVRQGRYVAWTGGRRSAFPAIT